MKTDYGLSSICHIAKADFLQRIRSNWFLIGLGACIFIIYSFVPPLTAGYKIVSLGNYRGFYNSAWIGSMVAMCVPFFTLIGFYVVNNSVKRDIDTGVGQIIATTRVTRFQYLAGKMISNFAVLFLVWFVIVLMTVVMFFVRGETARFEPWKLLAPLVILTLPSMFMVAAFALFFDSLTRFSRGFLNIAWFFTWIFIVSVSLGSPLMDLFGVNTCLVGMKQALSAAHPDWNGDSGTGILITGPVGNAGVFTWEGMKWTSSIILQRILWMALSFGLVVLASRFFNRFDPAGIKPRKSRGFVFRKKAETPFPEEAALPGIRYRNLPLPSSRFSFVGLFRAELTLMLRGNSMVWLVLTSGMFLASVFTPAGFSFGVALPLLWFFQILLLSELGSREVRWRCNEYIFAMVSPLKRQLTATFTAACLLLLFLALPVLIRILIDGNLYGMYALLSGALFIAAFAIASGILTGGGKLFQVIFTMMVYGILNRVPWFDFTGAIPGSREAGMANYFFLAAVFLVTLAYAGRKRAAHGAI